MKRMATQHQVHGIDEDHQLCFLQHLKCESLCSRDREVIRLHAFEAVPKQCKNDTLQKVLLRCPIAPLVKII